MEISPQYILTADIGGTHITTAICDTKTYKLLKGSTSRVEFNSKDTAKNILDAWETCFRQTINSTAVAISGLGIAMPGPFDYENGIAYIRGFDKFESLYGLNIKQYFAETLHLNPEIIKFRNDAEAAISGEVWANYSRYYKTIAGITLGTGFGSALHINGITRDANWGSLPYKHSIADDYLSTRWFVKRYQELTGIAVNNVKELILEPGNQAAIAVFEEFAYNLTNFLIPELQPINPDALIICGNISKASYLFLPFLKTGLAPMPIELACMGENAALLGVASLFVINKTTATEFNQS